MNDISLNSLMNAITDAFREIQNKPEDSIQDIFNEALKNGEDSDANGNSARS